MTEQPFLPGDPVQYQGHGPVMQVVLTSGTLCYCRWVDEARRQQHGTFETRKLTPAPADDKPAPSPG